MEIPNFKSEGQRQAYWKKQRMIELQLDEQNEQKLSKAYHDVDFGVIPAARDNRSIKEIEQDTTLQMINAKKNAMTLMNNDGAEADKLLDHIGKRDYATFNRFAPDIIEKLRNQIGRISAIEAMKEIGLHFAMQLDPYRRVPPSADQIDNLIMTIDSRFTRSNTMVRDILQRLEAYAFVVGRGPIPPDVDIPMSAEDVEESISILDEIDNDEEALASLEEKSVGITLESNASLLEEISTAAESKGTPADEETKGGDDENDENDENDDDDGEYVTRKPRPKPDPEPELVPDDDDDEVDEEEEANKIYANFRGNMDELRQRFGELGNYYRKVNDAIGSGEDPPLLGSYNAFSLRALLKFIGIVPPSALTLDKVEDIYKQNAAKIGKLLDNYDPNRIYTGASEQSNSELVEGLKDRLANFQYIEFDPNRPNPGKIKDYPRRDAVLFANAQLYKDLYSELKNDVDIRAANVTTTRGGKQTTEKIGSASDLYFNYKALQEMATGKAPRTDKHLTYGELKRILDMPIYRETYEKIVSDDLTKISFYMPPTGSGFRRKSRRGRR
jgi:hypothetical protein